MKMNLLLVNYMETTAPGGINTAVRQVGRTLALRGHEVTVLQPNPGDRPREEVCNGITIQRVDAPLSELLYGFDVFLWADLKARYSVLSPDVVHVQGYHSLFSSEAVYLVRRLDPRYHLSSPST